MAFASRIGNAFRKISARSNSSLLQAVRCMSSSKLFVGGLSYATDENSLKNAFSHYGTVLEARVIVDRDSGRSRGFGFVTYSTTEDAAAAVTAMDGKDLQGRTLKVNYANDRAGGIRGGGDSFTSGNGYATGGYGSTGGYDNGGYVSGHGSDAGGCGSHSGGYAGSGGYSDGATGSGFANNYNNASSGAGGYISSAGYRDAATTGGYDSSYNNTSGGGYAGGNGGYSVGGTRVEYASSYNNVSGHGYASGNSAYGGDSGGYVTNYNNTSGGKYAGGSGSYGDGASSGYATNYNSTSGGKYAGGNRGYGDGATGGYATNNASNTNYNSTSGGKYAGGNCGYGDGATGGYATNNASSTNYDSASGGGYGISGSYDVAGNSNGNTSGYNSPPTYSAGKHNPGPVGSGTFGEFSGGFRSGDSGSAGLNNGNNFTGSPTGDSYNRSTSTGGFSGSQMGFGSNKVQYNGQDDLLGENFFDDKEAAGNI